MITLDFETCGLHSIAVLLQFSIDDGEVCTHDIWLRPVHETLDLIELIANHKEGICGFNLAFDWFHAVKLYTVLSLVSDKNKTPLELLDEIPFLEPKGCDGLCVKPHSALDLMLHAKRGLYQSTMEREDVRIRKIPKQLAHKVAEYLNDTLQLNPIYFMRAKDPYRPWHTLAHKDKKTGEISEEFDDIILKFSPSGALKTLYCDIFKIPFKEVVKFKDVELPKQLFPKEIGYAPYALAVESGRNHRGDVEWHHAWPAFIKLHINHWKTNLRARQYAEDDVRYTRKIWEHFGRPAADDNDSVLACAVAANRWRGFKVNVEELKTLRNEAMTLIEKVPIAGNAVKKYILDILDDEERMDCENKTNKVVLEGMEKWMLDCDCGSRPDCKVCAGKGKYAHPVAARAKRVRMARTAKKEIELYDKIIKAGRFHASFKVIGTLSGRMSGADGLNAQGIKGAKKVRRCFQLAPDGMELTGGDFESFEVVIAVASYKDPKLEADLATYGLCPDCLGEKVSKDRSICQGCDGRGETKKKIHGIFGSVLYNMTYDEIVRTKGQEPDLYYQSKRGVFSQMYGGNEYTLMDRLGLSEDDAKNGAYRWATRYDGVAKAQQKTVMAFQSMKQLGAIGSKIIWSEPAEKIESLLGFPRYFTLENTVCRAMFQLAEKPPKEWTNIKLNVIRRDRLQTACGAVRSAIFGAAFGIQGANTRAAINHVIQSTGAEICKDTQRKVWDLQPAGIGPWKVMVMNIHDEIMAPCTPDMKEQVEAVVAANVEKYRPIVPLIAIDWSTKMQTWADK